MPRLAARDFTSVSAACALSFITSPSWPVRISLPLPGVRLASMNRMSPPTGVHARPVATPGRLVRLASSASNSAGPRISASCGTSMRTGAGVPSAMLTAACAQDRADLALEVAHARLARVVADDRREQRVAGLDLIRPSARSPRAGA